MKRTALILVVLLAGLASAQNGYNGNVPEAESFGIFGFNFTDIVSGMVDAVTYYFPILIGAGLTLTVIIALQYLGIDIIGLIFGVITFLITTFMNIVQWVLSNEENLIAAVILFIVMWLFILGFI